MTVNELIKELSKYNGNNRVVLCNHGKESAEKQDEILGSFEQTIEKYGSDRTIIEETVVVLYEY